MDIDLCRISYLYSEITAPSLVPSGPAPSIRTGILRPTQATPPPAGSFTCSLGLGKYCQFGPLLD